MRLAQRLNAHQRLQSFKHVPMVPQWKLDMAKSYLTPWCPPRLFPRCGLGGRTRSRQQGGVPQGGLPRRAPGSRTARFNGLGSLLLGVWLLR
jgi:hypothetical protein